MLFRLELRHSKQMAEDLQLMALGEFVQIGNGFRDEGHGLVRAALPQSIRSLSIADPCLKLCASGRRLPCSINLHPILCSILQK